MKNVYAGYVLTACAALLGMSFSTAASAADVTKLVEPCFACHGNNGVSADPDMPNIAGNSEAFLITSIKHFQKKERPCVETEIRSGSKKGTKSDMCKSVKDLSEGDVQQIAAFFAEQPYVRTQQAYDAALAKKGRAIHKRLCDSCHSEDDPTPSDHTSILGGQKMAYIREQIKHFQDGTRPIPRKMKPKLEALDSAEIETVIHYYGSFK